jgi:importin subunit beta-1
LAQVIPLVIIGIKNFEAVSLCKVSMGTLVDICTNVGGSIQPYCDQIMQTLFEGLKDNNVDKTLKPVVFSCLGDIAMAICGAFEPYLQVTTMLLLQAAQQVAPADNEDMAMFINELRYSVLEAYSGVLVGLADGKKLELFLPIVQNILPFLEYLSTPESNRDDDVLKKAVTLLGDIAKELGSAPAVKPFLGQPFVMRLLSDCSEVDDDESLRTANWTHQQVNAALQG